MKKRITMCEDADYPEFLRENYQRSRKEYKCCECGISIPKNSIYFYSVGKWDGDISYYRTCSNCQSIKNMLTSLKITETLCFGQLINGLQELNIPYSYSKLIEPRLVANLENFYRWNPRKLNYPVQNEHNT